MLLTSLMAPDSSSIITVEPRMLISLTVTLVLLSASLTLVPSARPLSPAIFKTSVSAAAEVSATVTVIDEIRHCFVTVNTTVSASPVHVWPSSSPASAVIVPHCVWPNTTLFSILPAAAFTVIVPL